MKDVRSGLEDVDRDFGLILTELKRRFLRYLRTCVVSSSFFRIVDFFGSFPYNFEDEGMHVASGRGACGR
jgi:hypothetical protein